MVLTVQAKIGAEFFASSGCCSKWLWLNRYKQIVMFFQHHASDPMCVAVEREVPNTVVVEICCCPIAVALLLMPYCFCPVTVALLVLPSCC